MRLRYTLPALADLTSILDYIVRNAARILKSHISFFSL
jgi:plasmid stabilization system protein ParE